MKYPLNPIVYTMLLAIALYSCKKQDKIQPKETVVYQTNFDTDDGHWTIGNTQDYNIGIQNGYYTYVNKNSPGTFRFTNTNSIFNNVLSDIAIETSIKFFGTTTVDNDYAGVCFNIPSNKDDLYGIILYNDGYFGIFYVEGNSPHTIQEDTFSNAVKKNDFNVLKVEIKSGKLIFYINGVQVYQMASGNIKLDLAGFITRGGVTMQADYFKALRL